MYTQAGQLLAGLEPLLISIRKKTEEEERLMIDAGSLDNMAKIEWLKKTHATGVIPVVLAVLSMVLIPYLVAQIPVFSKLLELIGVMKP